jgi:hypothetical protein
MAPRKSALTPDEQFHSEQQWLASEDRRKAAAEADRQIQFVHQHDPKVFILEDGLPHAFTRGSVVANSLRDRASGPSATIRELGYEEYLQWDQAEEERLAAEESARIAAAKAQIERVAAEARKAAAKRLAEARELILSIDAKWMREQVAADEEWMLAEAEKIAAKRES